LKTVDIGYLLDRSAISPRVNATDKRQALSVIAEIAGRHYGLKPSTVLNALLRREAQGSTGVGHGVATPHARLRGLDRMRGVFVRLETPIEFGALDEQPVDLLFALLQPAESSPSEHLQALAKVSRLLRAGELRSQLRQASGLDAIHALLVRDNQASAA
jgi:PTS system nitrogen regulatory IIA component